MFKAMIAASVLGISLFAGEAKAQITVLEGFEVELFATLPELGEASLAFAPGGAFGTDLYVGSGGGRIYRVDCLGQVSLFTDTGGAYTAFDGLAFGLDEVYGRDLFVSANFQAILRVRSDGSWEVFSQFNGSPGAIDFDPSGDFGGYLYSQGVSIFPDGTWSPFGGSFSAEALAFSRRPEYGTYLYVANGKRIAPDGTQESFGGVSHSLAFAPDGPFGGLLYGQVFQSEIRGTMSQITWPRLPRPEDRRTYPAQRHRTPCRLSDRAPEAYRAQPSASIAVP